MRNQAENRPLTSNRAVGFGNKLAEKEALYQTKTKIDLTKKIEGGPEEQFKILEREINTLIEESAMANLKGNNSEALEKAKEAVNKEKNLRRQREQ